MSDTKHHIVSYRSYALILLLLLVLTGISVAVTQIELTRWATIVALLLASAKSAIVLGVFMHLKFDHTIYKVMAIFVLLLMIAVIVLTFFDYGFR